NSQQLLAQSILNV
ncbi:hypothetical protein D046_4329B, partial [Vibrio parahaemolyticus V-223/04]